ncbi:MAG: hypothetical protein C4346_16425 [Chloroflexota bacterium]
MNLDIRRFAGGELTDRLPETPHELPYNRTKIVELMDRVRRGEGVELLTELLNAVDWRAAFVDNEGKPLTLEDIARLYAYYKQKFADIGPVYLADLLSTEFMTESLAQGEITMSDALKRLGRENPELWQEIRQFFRRKEIATGLLIQAHYLRGIREAIQEGDSPS